MGTPRVLLPLGSEYGQLAIVAGPYLDPDHTRYRCRCVCGNEVIVTASNLKSGSTKSCGCWKLIACRAGRLRHGGTKTKLYYVWWTMLQRCQNPNVEKYPIYGGRGITVCAEWQRFDEFQTWAQTNGYQEGLTIDRRDNDGPYSPANCRWVTMKVQRANRRDSVHAA